VARACVRFAIIYPLQTQSSVSTSMAQRQYQEPERGIFVEIGNQADRKFLFEISERFGGFDTVLDDGSHKLEDIITSLEVLFPLLRDGGMYIIEDAVCIRDQFDYFFSLTRHVMQMRSDGDSDIRDYCVDPFKIKRKTNNPFAYGIQDIIFANSVIVIHKQIKQHWVA
jgi:hypothetical protein